ncbi:MAG: hypothetical protein AB7G28_22790 [Pirellulales bacterium]
MAAPLYFAAGLDEEITLEVCAKLDLAYAFDRIPTSSHRREPTPSGTPGMLFADELRLGPWQRVIDLDAQQWIKRQGDDCVYLGWWKASPPTPDDLARRSMPLRSMPVYLADGRPWEVPRLLVKSDGDGFSIDLPTYYDLDAAGHWTNGRVLEKYRSLEQLAERLYQGVYRNDPPLDTEEVLDIAAWLLSVNYHVSAFEIAKLQLFPSIKNGPIRQVIAAASDHERALRWLEKKKRATSPAVSTG